MLTIPFDAGVRTVLANGLLEVGGDATPVPPPIRKEGADVAVDGAAMLGVKFAAPAPAPTSRFLYLLLAETRTIRRPRIAAEDARLNPPPLPPPPPPSIASRCSRASYSSLVS